MKKVLIVVDMQNDFVSGSLGTPEARGIVENIKQRISEYHQKGDRIIFTKDTHYDNYLETQEGKYLPVKHCIYGTDGWAIVADLDADGCTQVHKPTFGYEHWKNEDIGMSDEIELVGVCTDICVITNALLLKTCYPEIKITVDATCCAGTTPEKHRVALEVMRSCQINIED